MTEKANRLFKYQQKNKRELSTPSALPQCKTQKVNFTVSQRKTKRATTSNEFPAEASLIHIQTDVLNVEFSEQMKNVSEMKENFSKELKEILCLFESKGDVISAIRKLCTLIQSSHERMNCLHDLTQQSLLKLLAVQKDLELSNERRDDLINANCDKIQSIETKIACSSYLNKIFITFTCENELNELRKSKNLIGDAKNILSKMEIDISKFGILSIRSAHVQHIKVGNCLVPTLCITFINDRIAGMVRKRIMIFNAKLDKENRLNELKYCGKVYWSKDVWKLLKICWELKRLNLINSAYVNPDGIRVQYNASVQNKDLEIEVSSINVTSYNDIDRIRSIVGDIYPDVSCKLLYDNSYFKLNFSERDSRRSSDFVYDSDDEFSDADKQTVDINKPSNSVVELFK